MYNSSYYHSGVEEAHLIKPNDVFENHWLEFLASFSFILSPFILSLFVFLKSRQKWDSYTVPYTLPVLKNTIPFVFDGLNFLRNARTRFPYGSTIRVPIFREDVYCVQGPRNVAEMFHNPQLTITRSWSLVLKQCFGMQQKSVDAYLADTSGTRRKPIPGSSFKPQDRLSYMTHENLTAGLLQNGLGPATDRFREYLEKSFDSIDMGHDWTYVPDMTEFIQTHLGSSLIRTLFGEKLLAQNPDFIQDLWEYDEHVMSLAKRYPRFWIPRTYRIRDKLLAAVKEWHAQAVQAETAAADANDRSLINSWWGTKMMRDRYWLLLGGTGQDEASVASTNLAFIWSSVTTVVPSSTTMLINMFSSPSLLSSLRKSVFELSSSPSAKELESVPLLLSTYAETLRYGIHIHVPRSAPHHDVQVQGVTIPKNSLILLNTRLAHTDEEVWDTHDGKRPLDQFCPDRFLVDPKDPSSGPTKVKRPIPAGKSDSEPYFSSEGLEGAWFPYGGGQHACPGRLLAKRIMLLSAAMLMTKFDIELQATEEALKFDSPRFGFGVSQPSGQVPFRIRRRNHVCNAECAYFIDT